MAPLALAYLLSSLRNPSQERCGGIRVTAGKPLRILVVCHHALPHVGGLENAVDLEIRGLLEAGHRVTLLTSNLGGAGREPTYPAHVRTIRISAWHGPEQRFGIPFPLFTPLLVPRLWRLIGEHDLVHAHGFMFMNSALAVWLAHLRG